MSTGSVLKGSKNVIMVTTEEDGSKVGSKGFQKLLQNSSKVFKWFQNSTLGPKPSKNVTFVTTEEDASNDGS